MTEQSTQEWFRDLLEQFKDDPDFQKEGIIFELQEQNAKLKALAEQEGV